MESAVKTGGVVHVGTPPVPLSDWIMTKVHFHNFEGLPTERNEPVYSPEFSCFGRQWKVAIGKDRRSKEGYLAVGVQNASPVSIQASYKIVLKHPTVRTKRSFGVGDHRLGTIKGNGSWAEDSRGCNNFAKREAMLTYLSDGTLTLEIYLRTKKQIEPTSFVPSNPFNDNMLKGFNSEEVSDVAFEVGGEVESAANRRKRAKTATTTFYASHMVLRLNAPALADMCRPGDDAAVPINGVEPEVFKMLLYFCYGGAISDEELAATAKAMIEAADRFGIVNLKLQAEAAMTQHTEITVDNMLDHLLYANSKNLALFQEKIMDFVAKNGDNIVGKVPFDDVPSNLISDILTAFSQGKKSTSANPPEDDLKFMRVGELRKRLHEKGLCVDGSRETMIALLRENSASDETGAEET